MFRTATITVTALVLATALPLGGVALAATAEARAAAPTDAAAAPGCARQEARAMRAAARNQGICNRTVKRTPDLTLEACLAARNGRVARRLDAAGCNVERFVRSVGAPVASQPSTATVCDEDTTPDGAVQTESYVFGAINEKLAAHPDLAAELGFVTVSSCDDARTFMAAYNRFRENNPDRFVETAVDEKNSRRGRGRPRDHESDGDLHRWSGRIYHGQETDPYPTGPTGDRATEIIPASVYIGNCSGTFVSRNHILTSAHCFKTSGRYTIPLRQRLGGTWKYVDGSYTAYVYVYPNWAGTADIDDDIALVSIDDTAWSRPQGMMRISTESIAKGYTLRITGWGATDHDIDNPGRLQRVPPGGAQIQVSLVQTYQFRAKAGLARICSKDSGSATIGRRWEYGAASNTVDVANGITSAGQLKGNCPEEGKEMFFTRITKVKMDWIQARMRNRFGSSFSCTNTGSDIYRCF
jgi:hypothetical protein